MEGRSASTTRFGPSSRPPVRILLLTGTIGSGKTVVATEIGLLLEELGLPAAIVDLDWLGWVHLGPAFSGVDQLIAENLAAVWPNFSSLGVRHLVLVRALCEKAALAGLRRVVPDGDFIVVRLAASAATIEERLRRRDAGAVLAEHLNETSAMARAMDLAALEDFQVENDGRALRDVASEILRRAHWT